MSLTIEPAVDDPSDRPHSIYARPAALLLLLLAEAICFTMRFDAPRDLGHGLWWGWFLLNTRLIVRAFLLALVATGALGGFRLLVRFRRAFELSDEFHTGWTTWLLAHGIALVSFAVLASFVCEGGLATSAWPGVWISALIASGLTTGATWAASVLSPGSWMSIAKRNVRLLAMGVVVAIGALAASLYTTEFWDTMAGTTLALVRSILQLVARDVVSDPSHQALGIGNFRVQIAPVCSGFEGIGLIVAFLAAYLWRFRNTLRWPRAYLLLPLGVALIWVLNALRITGLILIGAWASPAVALGGFHSQAGWIAFLGVSLGLVAVSSRSSFFAEHARDVAVPVESNPSASFLGPFLVILATSMITGAFTSGFDAFYGIRVLTGGLALWYFRRDFVGLLRGCSWVGIAIGVIAFGLWVALEPASTEASRMLASTVGSLPRGQAWAWIALRVIGSVAIVPLAEELAFRGYLTRRLISIDFESLPIGRFSWLAFLLSSAAFGLLHGRWLAGMLVGLLYALAMYRRGKLGDAVVAHAVTNLLIAVTVLATGDYAMWS